jgi:hypothetical protein
MDETDRRAKSPAQAEELHAAIRRFDAKFEQACDAMGEVAMAILQRDGLRSHGLARAVLSGLTADTLGRILASLLAEVRPDESDRKIIAILSRRIQALIADRDRILRGARPAGGGAERDTGPGSAKGLGRGNSRRGMDPRPTDYRRSDFDALSQRSDELGDLIREAGICIFLDHRLASRFRLGQDKAAAIIQGS